MAGVSPHTVRHYQRIGLLHPEKRPIQTGFAYVYTSCTLYTCCGYSESCPENRNRRVTTPLATHDSTFPNSGFFSSVTIRSSHFTS
ncbi:MAG TPA: hypothetical protein DIC52_11095 [Candidatus Latescibacteria bacterium]|nr:hypothetical protein [Candidatus Latescibacterota bacterium]